MIDIIASPDDYLYRDGFVGLTKYHPLSAEVEIVAAVRERRHADACLHIDCP